MSSNCINAQNLANELYNKYSHLNWQGVLTRLWTGEKELNEYKKKYGVQFPLEVDATNGMFFNYGVKNSPTLIAINDGKEIFRINDFSDPKSVSSKFAHFE